MTRQKSSAPKSYDEILTALRSQGFDVQPVPGVANRVRIGKHGCAAELTRADYGQFSVTSGPGCVVGGEIAVLVDRGYQKFLTTNRLRIAATADRLRALHQFHEELTTAGVGPEFYNLALGTVSDVYLYDRVRGREPEQTPEPAGH